MGLVMSMGTLEPHAFERAARGENRTRAFPDGSIESVDVSYLDAEGKILASHSVHRCINRAHRDGTSLPHPDSACAKSEDRT